MARSRTRSVTARLALDPALYAGVRAVSAVVNAGGLDESVRVLRSLGGWYATSGFSRKRLARAQENIAWAFPEWDERRVRETAVASYRTLFGLAAEVAWAPRIAVDRPDGFPLGPRVEIGETREAIPLLLSGRPCLLITGHCGNWEALGAALSSLGIPIHALYRPLNQPPIDAWVRRTRSSRGLRLLDKFGVTEGLPRIIERGEHIGFTADQNAGNKGVFAPFFGRLASSYKSIGLLAMQHRTPLVCGQARRLGGRDAATLRYRLEVSDIIYPEQWDGQPDPLFYITARYRRAIELLVRRSPHQYLWMHRYWKSRPSFERKGRAMPGAFRERVAALPWMTGDLLERIARRSELDARAYRNGH